MKKVIIYYILFVIFALGVPIYLISTRYQVFDKIQTPEVQLLGGFMIIAIVVFFFFRGQVKDMIEEMDSSKLKSIIKRLSSVSILLLLLFVVKIAKVHAGNAEFILTWSLISNIIASVFFVQFKDSLKLHKERG